VLILELARRADALDQYFAWADDAAGAALLVAAALHARSGRPKAAGLLALAWAFAAGQLFMSLLGQLDQAGPDPSEQPHWLVVSVKAALFAAAATFALSTFRHGQALANQETGS